VYIAQVYIKTLRQKGRWAQPCYGAKIYRQSQVSRKPIQRAKDLVKHVPGFWQTVQLSFLEKDVIAASVSSINEHLRGFNLVPIIRKTLNGDSLFACAPQPSSDRLFCVRVLTVKTIEYNQSQLQTRVINFDPPVRFRRDRPGNDLQFNSVG
jgi:hypothetical protein